MQRNKIFISAYACEPGLGSEIGVGWHWVLEMSRYFELWVLTRESNRATIEPWIEAHPEYASIHFLYYDLPRWARFWKRGLRGVRTYYNLWTRLTDRIVRRTMRDNGIALFHHLTYGNVMWPVSGYGSRQRFIWGPVGGLETITTEFSRHYSRRERMVERVRRLFARYTARSLGFRRRCRRADLILCKTEITRSLIPGPYRHKAVLFTDVAPGDMSAVLKASAGQDIRPDDGSVHYIVVGRLDAWRGFDLAIEALAKAGDPSMMLDIVGSGPDGQRLEALAASLGVADRVAFHGKVPMDRYYELMWQADVVLNPSLKEGAVTVSFDSMSMGKPLIAVDTTGYTRYFTDCAMLIPLTSRAGVIDGIAAAMVALADKSRRDELSAKARAKADSYSWHTHGLEIKEAIETLL